jgi:periplasmic copper chaperone A
MPQTETSMNRRTFIHSPLLLAALVGLPAMAHDFNAGDLRVDHPYATPTRPGLTTGAVYFRGIRNTGTVADRLLSASTPVAGRVEIHRMQMLQGAQGEVMQMRAVPALDVPAGATVAMKHGTPEGYHLMLLDLKAPLKDGDHFPVTLTFEKAGVHEVKVWVQTPRAGTAGHQH